MRNFLQYKAREVKLFERQFLAGFDFLPLQNSNMAAGEPQAEKVLLYR